MTSTILRPRSELFLSPAPSQASPHPRSSIESGTDAIKAIPPRQTNTCDFRQTSTTELLAPSPRIQIEPAVAIASGTALAENATRGLRSDEFQWRVAVHVGPLAPEATFEKECTI